MATTNGNKSDWITLLQEANSTRADKIPPGYKTRREWAKHFQISTCTFDRKIIELIDAQLATRKEFRVPDSCGALKLRPHFKIAKK